MVEADTIAIDNELTTSDDTKCLCRSRTGSIKTTQLSTEDKLKSDIKRRKSRIRHCIGYFIIFILASGVVVLPVVMILMKRTPVYRVTHQSTQKPITMSQRTRTTTTVITTTPRPIDHCQREFVAITKNMEQYVIGIAVADLNNDNNLDIVFICESKRSVFIVFNQGNNKFANWISYPIPVYGYFLTITDIDEDNIPDIIIAAEYNTYYLLVLLNDGYGNFNRTVHIPIDISETVYSIIASDINNDEKVDIIFTVPSANVIGILLNNGNLSFNTLQTYPVGQLPMSIYVDDLNNDKKLDLIVANTHEHNIDILYNQGNGIDFDRMNYSVHDYGPVFVRTTDLNNDNQSDIILVNYFSNNIVIYLNFGQENLVRYFNISAKANPLSIALNDYNNDDKIDIIIPNYHSNTVDVFFNDGNGMFSTTTSYIVYPLPRDAIAIDMNNDNKTDIVLANENYLGIILSECD